MTIKYLGEEYFLLLCMAGRKQRTRSALEHLERQKKKKNHNIFSSQLRADQMPGPPREGQLMCTLFLSMCQYSKQHQ